MDKRHFSQYVLPYIKSFSSYVLSVTDRKQIEDQIKDLVKAKSIYNALDIPDVRKYKEILTKETLISLFIHKNKSFRDHLMEKEGNNLFIQHQDRRYNIVSFQFNELPILNGLIENIAVFLFNEELTKVFFCGLFCKADLKHRLYLENNKTYLIQFK